MHYQDFLLSLAQIAGIIVGFANLATGFDRSKINEVDWGENKVRILVITEGGLLLIAFCFIPFLILFFTSDEYLFIQDFIDNRPRRGTVHQYPKCCSL